MKKKLIKNDFGLSASLLQSKTTLYLLQLIHFKKIIPLSVEYEKNT